MENESPVINSLKDKEINLQRYDLSAYPVLTDNYAPVEYLTAKVLKHSVNTKSLNAGGEMLALIKQQLDYGPRYMGTTGHVNIQNLLIAEMKDLTASSIIQSWDYRASDGNTYKLKNIIGRINPVNERRIILATHYDSKRFADLDPTHKDQPVPGANDSASGVAVLLDLARILSTSPEIPDIGIDFVFFDGEEGDINQKSDYTNWKPLGSTYFADHLNELYNNKPISAVVLDMVCDKNLIVYKELTSAENSSQQTEAFWNIAKKVYSRVFRDQIKFGIQDDHTALISAGIPAFLIIDFDYPYFHTTRDTVDKCSSESLKTVAESVYNYLYTLD
jgi:Zn-dependent M28 family amino/carboxypeptidase